MIGGIGLGHYLTVGAILFVLGFLAMALVAGTLFGGALAVRHLVTRAPSPSRYVPTATRSSADSLGPA